MNCLFVLFHCFGCFLWRLQLHKCWISFPWLLHLSFSLYSFVALSLFPFYPVLYALFCVFQCGLSALCSFQCHVFCSYFPESYWVTFHPFSSHNSLGSFTSACTLTAPCLKSQQQNLSSHLLFGKKFLVVIYPLLLGKFCFIFSEVFSLYF